MAPAQSAAKAEREKKLKALIAFASNISDRFNNDRDTSLANDIQLQIRNLPLQPSSTVTAKQDELDRLGTELWNLSTRLRRDEPTKGGKTKDASRERNRAICLLRVFSFLLVDSAAAPTKNRQRQSCIRLMKVALKAARICIDTSELNHATKVLERAADYQDILSTESNEIEEEEGQLAQRSCLEYFVVRTALAWRQERMDTAEHMFAKCKQLASAFTPVTAETIADLLYEIGKDALTKRNYEAAVRWLERAHDVLGEQDMELLSAEAGELRLSTMHSIIQAHMKLNTPEAREKAWNMVKLMETDYTDKLVVSLLKIEFLSAAETIDSSEFYNVLLRMIRSVVLNDTNFRTIMHHIHKLKEHSNVTACKLIDDLIDIRLFREENQAWLEKAVITRIWLATINTFAENTLDELQELFDTVVRDSKAPFSAPATHAAQTLLWKRVEAMSSQDQMVVAEAWCRICLHPLFEKAGSQNQAKVARKIIQCALSRQDYAAARAAYNIMSDGGKDESTTRYLMYKVGLQSGDMDLAAESLDQVCRNSSKDATLLYACVMEAQSNGNKRQAINALGLVLDKYDHSAPAGIHLPALLRCTARLLQSELVKDGVIDLGVMEQLCKVVEGAYTQAKASRRRPTNSAQQLFTTQEFEWFSKNTYNLSLKYCAEMAPINLVRLLNVCIQFIKLLKEHNQSGADGDLSLRIVFCEFLTCCTYTTLARAEDNTESCLQYYLEARKHSQEFRRAAAEGIDKLGGSAQADIISKHFQIVKLELEAVLKLEKWDELDDLFDQCWKYKSPDHYETLADLVLVIHTCITQAGLDEKYQRKVLTVLQKIITLTSRQPGNDITKLSRWLRCLFNLALDYDETVSLKCLDKAIEIAKRREGDLQRVATIALPDTPPPSSDPLKGEEEDVATDDDIKESERYPQTELEWLATTAFNRGVDYYLQNDDRKCRVWADQSFVVAQQMDDKGVLRDALMKNFATLKLQD